MQFLLSGCKHHIDDIFVDVYDDRIISSSTLYSTVYFSKPLVVAPSYGASFPVEQKSSDMKAETNKGRKSFVIAASHSHIKTKPDMLWLSTLLS